MIMVEFDEKRLNETYSQTLALVGFGNLLMMVSLVFEHIGVGSLAIMMVAIGWGRMVGWKKKPAMNKK